MKLTPLRVPDSRLAALPFGRKIAASIDLGKTLTSKQVSMVNDALMAHGLLLFEGQSQLKPEMEWAFISSLPWLDKAYSTSLKSNKLSWWQFSECPMVRRLGDAVDDSGKPLALLNRIGYEWHTDGAGATLLYCERSPLSPPRTTLFASGAAAYNALPNARQLEAETVVVHYSTRFVTGDTATIDYEAGARMSQNGLKLVNPCREIDRKNLRPSKGDHARPLVRIHPPTSRKILWASPKNMDHLEVGGCALSVERSRSILEEFLQYGTDTTESDLVYEHRWKPGDVVLIDNRAMLHSTTPYANDDSDQGQQLMHHISIKAKRPQPGWTDLGVLSQGIANTDS